MVILMVACLGARLTGALAHEWTGMLFMVLIGTHVWINRRWIAGLGKGRYGLHRTFNLMVNLALAGLLLLMAWGGLMNSRFLLGFLELEGSMEYRETHTSASYWLLVCAGIHAGLHWKIVAGWFHKNVIVTHNRAILKKLICMFWGLIFLTGIWASFDRDMGSKLFLGFGFDYWDPARPVALFYGSILSIMALYALAAHWLIILSANFHASPGVSGLLPSRSQTLEK